MEEYEEFDGSIGSKSNAFILLSEEEEDDQQGVTAFQSLYPQKTLNHQATCQDEGQQEHQKQESQQLEQQQQQQAQHEQQPQAQAEQQQRQQQQQQQQGQGQQGELPRPQKEQAEAQQQPKQQHKKRQKEQQQKQKEQAEQQAARAAMLELQAARLPKPWSADDVNPVCLPPAATSWLLPPSYTTSTKDATEAIEAAAALADRHTPRERKAIDLRKMSRQQLEAASYKHNLARNIEDPCQEAMEGIREHVGLVRPSCEVYPITIGGNPRVNEYSRAWNALLRGKGMVAAAPAAAGNGAARAQPAAEDKKPGARPLQKEAPRTNYSAYGEYTQEQQTFNALLATYLDVPQPLVLPLLALGNPVCDLKALFLKVAKDCGGWVATCQSNKWPDIAQELQRGPQHSHILKEVYAYYLLPVEVGMARASGSARPASVNQWLESKVTERKNNGSEESRRPSPATVSRAVQAADEGMQSWAQDFGTSAAMPYLALELLKQAARDPLGCSSSSALATELRHLIQSAHGNTELAAFVTQSMAKGAHEVESGQAGHAGSGFNGRESLHGREGSREESSEDDGSGAFAGKGRKRGRLANSEQQQQEQQQEQQQQQAQQLALAQAQQRRRRREEGDAGEVWLEKEQQLVDAAEEEVVDKVDGLIALARSLRQKDARPPFFGAPAPDVLSHFKTQFELVKGYPFRSSSQPPKPPPLTRQAQAAAATAGSSNPKQHTPTPASAANKPSPSQPAAFRTGSSHHRQPSPSKDMRPMPSNSRQHQPPSSSSSQLRLQTAAAATAAAAPEKKHTTRQSVAKDSGRDGAGPAADAAAAAAAKMPPPDAARKVSRAASEEGSPDPPVKRARGPGSGTPKCGTCHTCRNPSLKKACLTNRERMAAGKEPITG